MESVRKNDHSLRIVCLIIFLVEFYNIFRVVFLSQSGLTTRNNRTYFYMYCVLILFAVLWVVLGRLLREAGAQRRWIAQYTVVCLIFLWHLVLNTYDLYRDVGTGVTVLTTALLALALLIQMPPMYSIPQYIIGYLLFWVFMAPKLDSGNCLNLTISFLVALAVSLVQTHHAVTALKQQKQIVQMNAKLQDLVQLDSLTGLLNKTTMECRVEQLIYGLEHRDPPSSLTLFLLDMDGFKGINDRYGHPCGDHVLVETAMAMRDVFDAAVGLGRIGGDEFAVLYDFPMDEDTATALGQQLVEQLGSIQWQSQSIGISCSVGVCACANPKCSYQQLYAETDRMLYRAKQKGRGQCCFQQWQPEEGGQLVEEAM
ncbi:MAG: GGDEF domain-containing protein [Acutalibacter sp.]